MRYMKDKEAREPVFLQVNLSPEAARMLRKLVETGLFGRSPAEVAQGLIYERLRLHKLQGEIE